MKKQIITTLSFFALLIGTTPITHAQFYYYNYNNGSNNNQQDRTPNYYYQYSGPPTAEAMEQLNNIMKQFFSQNNFSGENYDDFSFSMPQQFFSQQIPNIPMPYLPNFQNYSMPNQDNNFMPEAPITEKAPSYKESPDIYY